MERRVQKTCQSELHYRNIGLRESDFDRHEDAVIKPACWIVANGQTRFSEQFRGPSGHLWGTQCWPLQLVRFRRKSVIADIVAQSFNGWEGLSRV